MRVRQAPSSFHPPLRLEGLGRGQGPPPGRRSPDGPKAPGHGGRVLLLAGGKCVCGCGARRHLCTPTSGEVSARALRRPLGPQVGMSPEGPAPRRPSALRSFCKEGRPGPRRTPNEASTNPQGSPASRPPGSRRPGRDLALHTDLDDLGARSPPRAGTGGCRGPSAPGTISKDLAPGEPDARTAPRPPSPGGVDTPDQGEPPDGPLEFDLPPSPPID